MWLTPIELQGERVSLIPLDRSHHQELVNAVHDGELWKLWYTLVPHPSKMEGEIERRLRLQEQGIMLPFSVYDRHSSRVVGMTTFMNIDNTHRRLEIGSTWYARTVQRTSLNTECKLLLLTHAFEIAQSIAVEFRTHFFNTPSRRAIERIGAKLDGILRNHQRAANGTFRDTCIYSIIAPEWPTVKAHLEFILKNYPKESLLHGRKI